MLLQIVMGTMIPLIKREYLDYQKGPEERERWFIYEIQLTLLYGNDAGQKVLKL